NEHEVNMTKYNNNTDDGSNSVNETLLTEIDKIYVPLTDYFQSIDMRIQYDSNNKTTFIEVGSNTPIIFNNFLVFDTNFSFLKQQLQFLDPALDIDENSSLLTSRNLGICVSADDQKQYAYSIAVFNQDYYVPTSMTNVSHENANTLPVEDAKPIPNTNIIEPQNTISETEANTSNLSPSNNSLSLGRLSGSFGIFSYSDSSTKSNIEDTNEERNNCKLNQGV
ncbi:MAG: hypothetical protein ACK4PR_10845, partial [Gammaproteobacteria bacterium]